MLCFMQFWCDSGANRALNNNGCQSITVYPYLTPTLLSAWLALNARAEQYCSFKMIFTAQKAQLIKSSMMGIPACICLIELSYWLSLCQMHIYIYIYICYIWIVRQRVFVFSMSLLGNGLNIWMGSISRDKLSISKTDIAQYSPYKSGFQEGEIY